MTLIPWKTRREESGGLPAYGGMRTDLDRFVQNFFQDAFSNLPWAGGSWNMPLDVEEGDKEINVRVEIPGVSPEELNLSISDNTLVIAGEKKQSEEKRQSGYLFQERRFGSFRREVPLPSKVDAEDVQAEYKDGVLHVHLKKSQEALPKRIEIKTG
jgi:HSP20 family protein